MPIFKDIQTAEVKLFSLRYRANKDSRCTLAITDLDNIELNNVRHLPISREKAEYLHGMIEKDQVKIRAQNSDWYTSETDFSTHYVFEFNNLNILLAYMDSINGKYDNFSMGTFGHCELNGKAVERLPDFDSVLELDSICSTAACLLGNMPSALGHKIVIHRNGEILAPSVQDREDNLSPAGWLGYGHLVTGINTATLDWDFMFGSLWTSVNNSIEAACLRLQYYILWGTPVDFGIDTYSETMEYVTDVLDGFEQV